ncbi:cytochrome c oxidase subunit II [bacterium]|nr:cytochrome c oxidase subunit II [bacterium]
MWQFPLFPEQASTIAGRVDTLFWVLIGLAGTISVVIAALIVIFAVRYRRGSPADRGGAIHGSLKLEIAWAVIPFFVSMGVFGWGAQVYFDLYNVPPNGLDVYGVGKQWMWKFQHPTGQSEINMLHVPVNRPVRMTLISQDVIHSFYVPAFRVKRDVLPGRYTTAWFEATQPGVYHLFCTEFCGTEHSDMIGSVVVLSERDYQAWLEGRPLDDDAEVIPEAQGRSGEMPQTMASAGEQLFQSLGCPTCHQMEGVGVGPSLVGVYGSKVQLANGETVTADIGYIRTSIIDPHAQIVAGYQPIMPTYAGQVDEEELLLLVEYVQSLGEE